MVKCLQLGRLRFGKILGKEMLLTFAGPPSYIEFLNSDSILTLRVDYLLESLWSSSQLLRGRMGKIRSCSHVYSEDSYIF
jgi:hypothetical protein